MSGYRIIKVRTGELRVSAGFWWAQHRDNGRLTVVEVTEKGGEFGVMFIGNLNWPDLDEAIESIELIALIESPYS